MRRGAGGAAHSGRDVWDLWPRALASWVVSATRTGPIHSQEAPDTAEMARYRARDLLRPGEWERLGGMSTRIPYSTEITSARMSVASHPGRCKRRRRAPEMQPSATRASLAPLRIRAVRGTRIGGGKHV